MPTPVQPTFIGFGRELTRGTGVAATTFIPVHPGLSSPNDKYNYVDDMGMRGSALAEYGTYATQAWAEPGWAGDVFPDTIGNLLLAILGDVSDTGTAGGGLTTTLSGATVVGATSIATAATPTIGQVLQIDTGSLAEMRTVANVSGAGPYTVTWSPAVPLANAHANGVAVISVNTATNPYTHTFALLNASTASFQPPSQTLLDYNGFNARQIPGFLASQLTIKFTATGLLEYDLKGAGFKSATTTKPTQVFSAETVKPAWQGAVTIGGSGTTFLESGEISIARTVAPVLTVNGTQDPAAIFAAADTKVDLKLNLVYNDDTEYARYTGTTATTLDINFTSGAGTAVRAVRATMSNVFYKSAPLQRSGPFSTLAVAAKAYGNTTDIGASGGYSPIKVAIKNVVPNY